MTCHLPAVVTISRRLCAAWLVLLCMSVTLLDAQVTEKDIADKPIPKSEVKVIANVDKDKAQASNSPGKTSDEEPDILPGITLDGEWRMPGGTMTISGGVGSVSASFKTFGKNSYGISGGSSLFSGTFNGRSVKGQIVLRGKDEDGQVHQTNSPISLTMSADANTLNGNYQNRRFNKTKKTWSDETRTESISFSRVNPIDEKTLAAAKAAAEAAKKNKANGDDETLMAGKGEGEEKGDDENAGDDKRISITSITTVDELSYYDMQTKNREGKDASHIGNIWLLVTGENLPVGEEALSISIDDPNITYTGQHKADPNDEKALQIQVNLAQVATPGPKGITLNEAKGTWDYDYADLTPKSIDFVRQVYVDVANPATDLYRGEMFFVRVKFPMPVQFASRTLDLIAGKEKLMDIEITPFEGNKMIFQSKALILPGDKAVLEIFKDQKGTGIDTPADAITLKNMQEGTQLVAMFQGSSTDTAGNQQLKPYARATVRGLPSNLWIKALSKAKDCWESSGSSAKSKSPKGYAFTNEIIFTTKRHTGEWFSNTRTLHMTIRDHAACLLIRDEAIKQLRAKIQQYNKGDGIAAPKGRTEADKQTYIAAVSRRMDGKRQFAAQMSAAAGRGLGHPLMRMQVSGPGNSGQMTLQEAITPARLSSAFGDATSINALNYAATAVDQAQGVMLGNMSYALDKMVNLDDCDYEGLLRVCGFGFGSIGLLVKDKLLIPSNEPGVAAGRMVPDRAGYASVDRINTLYKALRAEEAYSRSDRDLAIFVATAPFLYLSVAAEAGTLAATIAKGGMIAAELTDLAVMSADAYDYIQLRDEQVQFREGLSEVAGMEGIDEVEADANEKFWNAMMAGGAGVGGVAVGEIAGVIAKRYGKTGFEALEAAVEKAGKKGTKSLSKAETQMLEQAGLLQMLGDKPSAELTENLVKTIRKTKELAEAGEKGTQQVASNTVESGTKNTAENLTDTVRNPSPPRTGADLTETMTGNSPTVKGEDLIDTVRNPSPPKTGADLTETMTGNSPTVRGEELIDTVHTAPPKAPDVNTPRPNMDDYLNSPMPPSRPGMPDVNAPKAPDTNAPRPNMDDYLNSPMPPSRPGVPDVPTDDIGTQILPPKPAVPDVNVPKAPDINAPKVPDVNAPKPNGLPTDDIGTNMLPPKPAVPDVSAPKAPDINAPHSNGLPTDDIGTNMLPPKVQTPNGGALDNAVPTPTPKPDMTPPTRALDVDINHVGTPDVQPPAPPAPGSPFMTSNGQVIQLGNKLGEGTFSDVFAIAGDDNHVIKFVKRSEDSSGGGLNAWQMALEGKQVSELLDANGIPQLKVLDANFTGQQPYMIVEKINKNMQILDYADLTAESRQALINAGKWSSDHEHAVVKLLKDMADKNLIWEDCHLGNVFFQRDANGQLIAGILDHGRIGKWGDLNFNMKEWVTNLEIIGEKTNQFFAGNIKSNTGTGGGFKFSSPQEFMAKMLEHKRWIEWDETAGKFKGVKLDPSNIDRNLFPLEDWVAPTAKPGSLLPQPFLDRWPWKEVLKPAA